MLNILLWGLGSIGWGTIGPIVGSLEGSGRSGNWIEQKGGAGQRRGGTKRAFLSGSRPYWAGSVPVDQSLDHIQNQESWSSPLYTSLKWWPVPVGKQMSRQHHLGHHQWIEKKRQVSQVLNSLFRIRLISRRKRRMWWKEVAEVPTREPLQT